MDEQFKQCADGLQDCSVWRWHDEFTMTERPDGGVTCLQQLIWRPAKFGPPTKEWHDIIERMIDNVRRMRTGRA